MRIESVLFGKNLHYERMARVMLLSAERNSPATPANVTHFLDSDREIMRFERRQTLLANTRKTKHHRELVREAADGEVLCLMDADTMVLGDLSEIESLDFELAITMRPADAAYPCNTGVVFVRVSDRLRRWYDAWLDVNLQMIADPQLYAAWKTKYGGINQSSLGYLLEATEVGSDSGLELERPKLLHLPCAIWNSIRETWHTFSPATKIVHILGTLRVECVRPPRAASDPSVDRLQRIWREYDAEAGRILQATGDYR